MYTLIYPRAEEEWYLIPRSGGPVYGPSDNLQRFSPERIPFQGHLEAMEEAKGIFHENTVLHDKIEGDLEYQPILYDVTPTPSAYMPDQVKVVFKNYKNTTVTHSNCYEGIAQHGGTAIRQVGPLTQHVAFLRLEGSLWATFKLTKHPFYPGKVGTAVLDVMTDVAIGSGDGATAYIEHTTYNCGVTGTSFPAISGDTLLSFKQIIDVFAGLSVAQTSNTTQLMYRYRRLSYVEPPTTVKDKIDQLVKSLLPKGFPLKEEHFGDLAMRASEKVPANSVNMLEFLRDMKDITHVLPKLSSLRSLKQGIAVTKHLKNTSSDYLAVKYGILPTISDLKKIVSAVTRHAPYQDRYGFDVYTAMSPQSLVIDGLSFTMEQRIKLAIGKEDNTFENLIERLESFGVLPTLENIWDLTRYSFVIDWFIDVGGFLERIDSSLRLTRLNIAYATMSTKRTCTGRCPCTKLFPFSGDVTWVNYHRWTSYQCPLPPLTLRPPETPFNHWLEAAALIIQRIY